MKTDQEMLSSILKTTQMGQVGIRSVLDSARSPELRQALTSQLKEYDAIEDEAHTIAKDSGWEIPELPSSQKVMSDMMSRMMLRLDRTDSKIAGMMIQGNTKGIIKSLKNQHHSTSQNTRINELSRKLLETEKANVQQMEPYL